jgi:hypothetical protein
VLRRQDDRVDRDRDHAVVADGDLRLAVRPQVVELARLAHRGEALGETVGEPDGQRHVLGGLVRRVAEHDALVAGALPVELVVIAAAGLERRVDALRDVGRLRTDRHLDAAGAPVEADRRRVVADAHDQVADDGGDVDIALGGHLAGDVDESRRHHGLDRHPARRVDRQQSVEDAVGDLIADLVGVALGHRLGGEQPEAPRSRVARVVVIDGGQGDPLVGWRTARPGDRAGGRDEAPRDRLPGASSESRTDP